MQMSLWCCFHCGGMGRVVFKKQALQELCWMRVLAALRLSLAGTLTQQKHGV